MNQRVSRWHARRPLLPIPPEVGKMPISKPKLKLLHTAKNKLHLSDPEYRAILREAASVSSASELEEDGFEQVLAHFQALGFKTRREERSFGDRPGMATPAQLELIRSSVAPVYGRT